jgi:hypothetical protein
LNKVNNIKSSRRDLGGGGRGERERGRRNE